MNRSLAIVEIGRCLDRAMISHEHRDRLHQHLQEIVHDATQLERDRKNRGRGLLLFAASLPFAMAYSVAINAFVLWKLWAWYVVPYLGAPAIPYLGAAGVWLLVRHALFVAPTRDKDKPSPEPIEILRRYPDGMVTTLLIAAVALGWAYLVHVVIR